MRIVFSRRENRFTRNLYRGNHRSLRSGFGEGKSRLKSDPTLAETIHAAKLPAFVMRRISNHEATPGHKWPPPENVVIE